MYAFVQEDEEIYQPVQKRQTLSGYFRRMLVPWQYGVAVIKILTTVLYGKKQAKHCISLSQFYFTIKLSFYVTIRVLTLVGSSKDFRSL